MDIDIPLTPIDEPVFHIDEQVLISIASAVAAAEGLKKAESADPKKLLNRLFSEAINCLHNALHERDPASWILEAYKQLQMWTFVYRVDMEPTPHGYEARRENSLQSAGTAGAMSLTTCCRRRRTEGSPWPALMRLKCLKHSHH
jgi:hypothetical protein